MIPKDAPILEPGERVLDACATAPMAPPGSVTKDAATSEARDHQLVDPAITAVGEHAAVMPAQLLDLGAAEPRPRVRTGARRIRIWALHDQR
jgi:hypothetical protein